MTAPLVDWLRAQDDETLAALLRLRPDLAVPPPADVTVLATRAGIRASVHRASDDLDTVALAVLEALVVADADHVAVERVEVARLLGPDVTAGALDGALDALRARVLVWGEDDGLRVVPAARDVVPAYPGNLGRRAGGPAASSELPALLAGLPAEERRVLDALVAGPPIGRSRSSAEPDSPVGRLLAKGLLLRLDTETVELPQQVGIALRGDRPMGRIEATPPALSTREWPVPQIDATAGGAAMELLRRVERLIELWGASPPTVLRSGGLGVRDLRRTARELETDEAGAALIVEVALAADLIGQSDSPNPDWLPTTAADAWAGAGIEQRWVALARAWLELPRLPGLVGRRDDADRPINALSETLRRPVAPRDRRRVLAALAALPPGTAVTTPEALGDLLAWRAPRRGGRLRDEIVRWTLEEGTLVGVVALDALAEPGRALLAASPGQNGPVVAALRAVLPEPVDTVLLQADLTAVAPGPLVTALARELQLMADVESAGGATVYRFSEASVRRALDSGRSVTDLKELLEEKSSTPVPQALTYLIEDVGRRHGRLRGGVASAFLRSDDEVLLSEVLAHPETAALELRRIAPTVAVSPAPLAELLDGLRAAGFSPAAEDATGGVLDLGPRGARTDPRRSRNRTVLADPSEERIDAVVAKIRAGDALAAARRGAGNALPANGSSHTLATLQEAARARRQVWIGYVDGHGRQGERVLAPLTVGGGIVEGRDAVDGEVYRLPLHRITRIALIER
ncbi:helicase-associated domain-containing protein [Pseudonocardia kujensis]|uniref:helicase-associated domain-containing protein n=1 Tax=Pseudonocardia kujensis TaxID=1128675 RepID=UPI001E5A0F5E|nr:helicase-associated domain-containing protein [Pseudonocardia kujensis]MCE0761556.1 helicase-associated domain-containing protein [Pseudonocardia kujensis]